MLNKTISCKDQKYQYNNQKKQNGCVVFMLSKRLFYRKKIESKALKVQVSILSTAPNSKVSNKINFK